MFFSCPGTGVLVGNTATANVWFISAFCVRLPTRLLFIDMRMANICCLYHNNLRPFRNLLAVGATNHEPQPLQAHTTSNSCVYSKDTDQSFLLSLDCHHSNDSFLLFSARRTALAVAASVMVLTSSSTICTSTFDCPGLLRSSTRTL